MVAETRQSGRWGRLARQPGGIGDGDVRRRSPGLLGYSERVAVAYQLLYLVGFKPWERGGIDRDLARFLGLLGFPWVSRGPIRR